MWSHIGKLGSSVEPSSPTNTSRSVHPMIRSAAAIVSGGWVNTKALVMLLGIGASEFEDQARLVIAHREWIVAF